MLLYGIQTIKQTPRSLGQLSSSVSKLWLDFQPKTTSLPVPRVLALFYLSPPLITFSLICVDALVFVFIQIVLRKKKKKSSLMNSPKKDGDDDVPVKEPIKYGELVILG